MQIRGLLLVSIALRALLIAYGELQDRLSTVKYTDVDYNVFTDAARYVAQGQSPFLRSTYRYSPLLAYLLVPNILVSRIWGKALFAAADVIAAWQIWRIGQLQQVSQQRCLWSVIAWLYNPFTVTISTRGSCDSVVTVLLLAVLLMLLQGYRVLPALVYGLVVHLRIYPIIYALAVVLYLAHRQQTASSSKGRLGGLQQQSISWLSNILQQTAVFGGISGGIFVLLGLLFYQMYGQLFLHEAFLHHITRKDPRHNFSVYYYPVYLNVMQWPGAAAADKVGDVRRLPFNRDSGSGTRTDVDWIGSDPVLHPGIRFVGRLLAPSSAGVRHVFQGIQGILQHLPAVDAGKFATVPQALLLVVFAVTLHRNQPLCWLLQTMAFVAYNKVSTAQYFVWYFSLLPAALQTMPWPLPQGFKWAGVAWVLTQLHWLFWGYMLEFQGRGVHLLLWFAGVLFLVANTAVMWVLLDCTQHTIKPLAAATPQEPST